MVISKDQLEASLREEKKLISDGQLKEDNPLDSSEQFRRLCDAARRGDKDVCQQALSDGANINARDKFDYTPLILASLCGHFETVQFLLEAGALCERDTFQGERCLYNALTDQIKNLLLQYDYSKSSDPLQPLASHVTSLLSRLEPKTSDISVVASDRSFNLHKFILAARSPYFREKLSKNPETTTWKLPINFPPEAFEIAIRYLYLGEIPNDVGGGPGTGYSVEEVLQGIDKISKYLDIPNLWQAILHSDDRRLKRQNHSDEMQRGKNQLDEWFRNNILPYKIIVDADKAENVKWSADNSIFADVLLRADDLDDEEEEEGATDPQTNGVGPASIPIGGFDARDEAPGQEKQKVTLIPAHRCMLIRSEFFGAMFTSSFLEAQEHSHLRIIPIDCTPDVLEIVLAFLYTEMADFRIDVALDVLYVADLLLLERLKTRAAVVITQEGNAVTKNPTDLIEFGDEDTIRRDALLSKQLLDPFHVLTAGWQLRVPRLEEFAARYIAYRLELYIDLDEFAESIQESAGRIKERQETDSVELIDDIRYYLSERFALRFEDVLPDEEEPLESVVEVVQDTAEKDNGVAESGEMVSEVKQTSKRPKSAHAQGGTIRTLDGEEIDDELTSDAINYQILMGKLDALLLKLGLDV